MVVEDLMPDRFRHEHVAIRTQAVEAGQVRLFGPQAQFVVLTSDGREVPVDIGISYSHQDEETQVLVSLRDISERQKMEAQFREQQEAFETAQAMAHVGSWDWHIDTNRLVWSDEIYRIFGVEPQSFDATYETFIGYVHPDDRERVQQGVSDAVQNGTPYNVEHRVVRPDGAERIVLEMARVFHDESGDAVRMVGTLLDITERKQVERELLFDKAIIEGVSQPIVVVDQDLTIVDMNDAYCEMSGFSRDELLGQTPAMLKSGRHDHEYYRAMWDSLEHNEKWQGEIWIRNKAGSVVPRLLSITRICEAESQGCRYVGFYSDITALKESEARLEKLAHFDQLTGLANRMLCHDRLRAAISRAHRSKSQVAVLYVDLDGFKAVNDRLGHQTGDMLLVEAAERMKTCVREDDTVARLGGDEFVIILNEIRSRDEVGELAGRLLERLKIIMGAGNAALHISGSIGIATYPQDGEKVDMLLHHADQAMYQAKLAGKDRCAFYQSEEVDAAEGNSAA
jgi:diguanylate cyclase (GGDEF)-like protein/PAS domain S-box-containing protein